VRNGSKVYSKITHTTRSQEEIVRAKLFSKFLTLSRYWFWWNNY